MKLNLADLDDRLSVGEVVEVSDDLREDGSETLLKRVDGIEVEMADGEIRRGRVGHHTGETMVDGGFTKSGADELMDKRDVLFAVVGDVEVVAGFVGVHDGNFDHVASGVLKDGFCWIRHRRRGEVKRARKETK